MEVPLKRSTIKEVARIAGFNVGTVSRALANKEYVAPDTRQRIVQVATDLGYRPSALARAMVTRRTSVLAMLAPSLTDPLFEAMVGGAEHTAREHGYTLLVAGAEAVESGFLHEHPVDGLLILEPHHFAAHLALAPDLPTVTMDDAPMNNRAGGVCVAQHLHDLGHRHVLVLGGPEDSPYALERVTGIREVFPDTSWLPGEWTPDTGYALAQGAQLGGITALLCLNDQTALGAMAALRERHLRIPADISVTGFDDEPFSRYLDPPLTTVQQDLNQQSRRMTDLLLQRLRGHPDPTPLPAQPLSLLTRASSGTAASAARLPRSKRTPK